MDIIVFCYWNFFVMEWVKIVFFILGFIGNGLVFLVIVLNKILYCYLFVIIGVIVFLDCIYCLGGVLWGFFVYGYMDLLNYCNLFNCFGDFFNIYVKIVMFGMMFVVYIVFGFFIVMLLVFCYIIVCCNVRLKRIFRKKLVVFIIIFVVVFFIIFVVLKIIYLGRFNKVFDIIIFYFFLFVIMIVFFVLKIIKMMKRRDF